VELRRSDPKGGTVASIEKKLTKAGAARYRVRWWDGPRRCERWFPTLAQARALQDSH